MALTGRLRLAPGVVLAPVAELAEAERRRLGSSLGEEAGSWVLSHPGRRTLARLIDAEAAALLAEFRTPCTVSEAVIAYGQPRGEDPAEVLEAAFPLLERLYEAGFLEEEGDEAAGSGAGAPDLEPGAGLAGWTVDACIRSLDDSEVYRLVGPAGPDGRWATLKIERPRSGGRRRAYPLDWEEGVLRRLTAAAPPRVAPALLAAGVRDGRRYLVLEWCPGVDAATAARTAREVAGRPGLLALGRAVLTAYAALHARGVVHGDVHPHNLLVAAGGGVRLVDFGAAVLLPGAAPAPALSYPGRTGVSFFFEPEHARALLAGGPEPPPTPAGEQYAVAALLYLLFAGAHCCDFRLAREEMLDQIAEAPPLPFAARGVRPWPEVEAVLARALAKDPAARFPSLAAFRAALDAVPAPAPRRRSAAPPAGARALLEAVLERAAPDSAAPAGLPANAHSGAAGVACGLRRIALAREDPRLLAAADLWAERAVGGMGRGAGDGTAPGVEPGGSLYHGAPGVFAVRALVAHARSDGAGLAAARAAFLAAARLPAPATDLALGRAGSLLAAAQLAACGEPGDRIAEGAGPAVPAAADPGLAALGGELLAALWSELDALPEVGACGGRPNLGIAHGWAGLLYATLRWCRAAGAVHPAGLAPRLAELAECAAPLGRGLAWPWLTGSGTPGTAGTMPASMSGWCNGSAGLVHLWLLAHRELGGAGFARLAEGAAWNAWEDPAGGGDLCCGLAGRAYALLLLAGEGGGREWLERARALAGRAAAEIRAAAAPFGLYRGDVGVAALVADLARPEGAAHPLFGDEGW